jgi:hypothetical protein
VAEEIQNRIRIEFPRMVRDVPAGRVQVFMERDVPGMPMVWARGERGQPVPLDRPHQRIPPGLERAPPLMRSVPPELPPVRPPSLRPIVPPPSPRVTYFIARPSLRDRVESRARVIAELARRAMGGG